MAPVSPLRKDILTFCTAPRGVFEIYERFGKNSTTRNCLSDLCRRSQLTKLTPGRGRYCPGIYVTSKEREPVFDTSPLAAVWR
jgi:hypothetical protein